MDNRPRFPAVGQVTESGVPVFGGYPFGFGEQEDRAAQQKRQDRQPDYHDLRSSDRAQKLATKRILNRDVALDGEGHHKPHADETAEGGEINEELAEARLVEQMHLKHVEPHDEDGHQEAAVANRQRAQVDARGGASQLRAEEHAHGQAVAQ